MNLEAAWKTLERINEWIRFADAKAAAILAGSGVLGGFLLRALPPSQDIAKDPLYYWLLIGDLVIVSLAVVFSLSALTPKLRAGEPRSLIYFDHIARRYKSPRKFFSAFERMLEDEEQIRDQVIDQLWANSRVARSKFLAVGWSTRFIGLAIILAGVAALVRGL